MSGLRDTIKGGWHPKGKDGKSKESWRGDFKGVDTVAGWMGKKKSPADEANEHVSRPLHQLKDPSAFGPPPKHINHHGGVALPNQITPGRGGLGPPLSRVEIEAKQQVEGEEAQREAEEAAKPKGPPVPFRADRTGFNTANLPPPPGHKDRRPVGSVGAIEPADKPKPPGLPPRLPPRQNSTPGSSTPLPPPTYGAAVKEPDTSKGILNQGALSRLGAAGVSVQGFGIAKSKPPLPPPSTPSPSRSPAPPASAASSAQLGELQSRFPRLLVSSSPKPDPPSEGTTIAQKRAALKTASSFRNDPSSVSLSDARVAASTANNFRERHGEQVKSGWQSANKLNTKYGIADKVGVYGGAASTQKTENSCSKIEMRDNTVPPPAVTALAKKKPAPPPPMKGAALSGAGVSQATQPPPIPMSSKPKLQPPSSNSNNPTSTLPKDLDLDLSSLWFTRSPIQFSPKLTSQVGSISQASTSGWSSSGVRKTHTYTTQIRYNDTLASTKIHITWDASNPAVTVKAQQKHYPPPGVLSLAELEQYRDVYNEDLAQYCESRIGSQVGNGECWTLASDGLKAVAAQHTAAGREPCMSSQAYIHGSLIYSFALSSRTSPSPSLTPHGVKVERGDVMQFKAAHFRMKGGGEAWAGLPDHTAVVTDVKGDGSLEVLEQNVGGVKKVKKGGYDMRGLVGGEVKIFRPVAEKWIGELDPSW